MEQENTMKPMYSFEWFDSASHEGEPRLVRETVDLENDSHDFREAGIELLAQFGREDSECEVTLVGFQQI